MGERVVLDGGVTGADGALNVRGEAHPQAPSTSRPSRS
jgi:hypothetical protein